MQFSSLSLVLGFAAIWCGLASCQSSPASSRAVEPLSGIRQAGSEVQPGEQEQSKADFAVQEPIADSASGKANSPQEPLEQGPNLEEARFEIAAGDLNRALLIMDELRGRYRGDPDFWILYGQTNMDFAVQTAAGPNPDGTLLQGLFEDAAKAFETARNLRPADPQAGFGALRAYYQGGNLEAAWKAGQLAMEATSATSATTDWIDFGRTGLALTMAAVQAGAPIPAAAREAEQALQQARDAGDNHAVVPLADLYAWQGLQAQAREVLVNELKREPNSPTALSRLQNLGSSNPEAFVTDLEQIRQVRPDDAGVLWYLGAAYFSKQAVTRSGRDFFATHEALDRAEESFTASMTLEPSYLESCQQYLHLVRTARGWALREEGRVDDAAQAFMAALEADPNRLEAEFTPGSLRQAIYAVEQDFRQRGDLRSVVAFLNRVTAVHKDNPDWQNNLGFAARDYGVTRQQQGESEESRQLFELSWTAYQRAAELGPEDVRVINDWALIAVYYLDQHWELAEQTLRKAIDLGGRQLAELPAETSATDRQNLEEAVGDAWENLAYLDVMRRQRLDQAPAYLEESVKYFPYQRRPGVLRIQARMNELQEQDSQSSTDGQ